MTISDKYEQLLIAIWEKVDNDKSLNMNKIHKDTGIPYTTVREIFVKDKEKRKAVNAENLIRVAVYLEIKMDKILYPNVISDNELTALSKEEFIDGMTSLGQILSERLEQKLDKRFDDLEQKMGKQLPPPETQNEDMPDEE